MKLFPVRQLIGGLLSCLLVLSCAALSASAFVIADDTVIYRTGTSPADGLQYEAILAEKDGESQRGYLFTYQPGKTVLPMVTYGTHVVGRETTGTMMRLVQEKLAESGTRVVGGINGDFFSMQTGIPMGVLIQDGIILSSDAGETAIGIKADGTYLLGRPSITTTLHKITDNEADALTLPIAHINKYPAVWGAYLCTPEHGKTTYSTEEGTEYVFKTEEGVFSLTGEVRAVLTEIREKSKNSEIPEDGFIIYLHEKCAKAEAYRALAVGDAVSVSCTAAEGWSDVTLALGGGDLLIENGEIHSNDFDKDHGKKENPRTAVGYTADGNLLFFAVDGRTTASKGLTLEELAKTMQSLGCIGAINLDGGGSTTVIVRGDDASFTVQNKPTDGVERKVSNAVLFVDASVSDGIPYYAEITPDAPLVFRNAAVDLDVKITDRSRTPLTFDNAQITWSAVGGTIDENGHLTPDLTAKTIDVTAQIRIGVTDTESGTVTEYVLETTETVFRVDRLDSISADVSSLTIPFGSHCAPIKVSGKWKGRTVQIAAKDVRASVIPVNDGEEAAGYVGVSMTVYSTKVLAHAQKANLILAITDDGGTTCRTTVPVTFGAAEQVVMNLNSGMPNTHVVYDSTAKVTRMTNGGRNGSAAVSVEGLWLAPIRTPKASHPVKRIDLYVKGTLPADLSAVMTCGDVEYILPWTVSDDFTRIGGWMRISLDTTMIDKKGISGFTITKLLTSAETFSLTVDDLTYFFGDSMAVFNDTHGMWAHDSIETLYRMGVVSGIAMGDGTYRFAPMDGLTRVEFAVMIAKFMGLPINDDASVASFADAEEIPVWGIPYIAAVTEAGYMRGKGAGNDENGNPLVRFASEDTMSRAEVLQVLGALLAEKAELSMTTSFADDADIPDWARTNITRIVGYGLISGFEDNTLRPGAVISRAEIAALLVRIHGILAAPVTEEEPTEEPTDDPVIEDPAETPTTDPVEDPTEPPTTEPVEAPTESTQENETAESEQSPENQT